MTLSSCTSVLESPSTSRTHSSALWVAVVAHAAAWHAEGGEDVAPVLAWLWHVCAWEGADACLPEVCRAAEVCRARVAWQLAWAVRAATAALVFEAVGDGRWPRWRAVPFAQSYRTHPLALGAEILEDAAIASGRAARDGWQLWRELAALHGVLT